VDWYNIWMEFLPYIFFAIFFILSLIIIRTWILDLKRNSSVSDEVVSWLKETNLTQRHTDEKIRQNMDMFNQRLDKASVAMMGVQKALGEFSEIGRSMQSLQEFLQSPKLRGNIGEQVLKELLAQSLPPDAYIFQYQFLSGERVDAVIKTSQGMISIDSKFPMATFKTLSDSVSQDEKNTLKKDFIRDVKKHINSISKKYILPSEGTMDYALMYIPAESVYYEIINTQELYDFASQLRVIPVSPMSFYAYLKVILVSLEGQRIHKEVNTIMRSLQSMRNDFSKVDEAILLLHKHVNHAHAQSSNVIDAVNSLGKKIDATCSLDYSTEKSLP
jgi:DNA recombination protein RmuC